MIYCKDVIIFIFVAVKFSFEPPAKENNEILYQTKISRYTVYSLHVASPLIALFTCMKTDWNLPCFVTWKEVTLLLVHQRSHLLQMKNSLKRSHTSVSPSKVSSITDEELWWANKEVESVLKEKPWARTNIVESIMTTHLERWSRWICNCHIKKTTTTPVSILLHFSPNQQIKFPPIFLAIQYSLSQVRICTHM